jgi:hypothetical protein
MAAQVERRHDAKEDDMTMMTTQTETVETEIEAAARLLRRDNPTLTRSQAFTQVLNGNAGLRHRLAEARQADRTPPVDPVDASCQRFADAALGLLSYRLRQQQPHLTEAAANVEVLRSQPVLRELLRGR